jgi:hypothetical protein
MNDGARTGNGMIFRKWMGPEDPPAKVAPIAVRRVRVVTPITDVWRSKC